MPTAASFCRMHTLDQSEFPPTVPPAPPLPLEQELSTLSPVYVSAAERLITGSCDTNGAARTHANAAVRTTIRIPLVIRLPSGCCKGSARARELVARLGSLGIGRL